MCQYFFKKEQNSGFSLLELLVAMAIVGILISLIYVNFQKARQNTRDKIRQTTLTDIQLAIERYKAQTGFYPLPGFGSAGEWVTKDNPAGMIATPPAVVKSFPATVKTPLIKDLVPSYIESLPEVGSGFYYWVDSSRGAYKLIVYDKIEATSNYITSYDSRFAACPPQCSADAGICTIPASAPFTQSNKTYAVYSLGKIAECKNETN